MDTPDEYYAFNRIDVLGYVIKSTDGKYFTRNENTSEMFWQPYFQLAEIYSSVDDAFMTNIGNVECEVKQITLSPC